VLLLARRLAAPAPGAALQVDHQCQAFAHHSVRCHHVIGPPPAT
jgi:hypothetical protein